MRVACETGAATVGEDRRTAAASVDWSSTAAIVSTINRVTSVHIVGHNIFTEFYLNNQQDALIIQIYCYKILHVSGIFSAHHREFSTVHSALISFMLVFDDRFQAESGVRVPS